MSVGEGAEGQSRDHAGARGWADIALAGVSLPTGLIAAATLIALLANLAVIMSALASNTHRSDDLRGLVRTATVGVALLSILAIMWETAVLMLPVCR